ncbi:hypothetical protein MSBRW_1568 [Methanosarcina barkeri str. Wiesmoor]|uniref:Uncharacterized protein n=1 Tax=Methanosarcina barkeri str. Wiesmoor TaxID=1434109 RepID=A0A0E3LL83_METBA|nr:hypothetical protein [Methanosarcina barkeri]AKB50821.1 hypothetical protein MSBRW_1568 [Methanosarcina barkeri str. Wiesmoor]
MPRHSKSKVWPQTSKLKIYTRPEDIVIYTETDERGHVQTNKKGWEKFKATVILGTFQDNETFIEVPENTLIWTCNITSRGRLSQLVHEGEIYSNEKVTVLVHVI